MKQLSEKGLMTEAGLKAFSFRQESKSKIYVYEKEEKVILSVEFEKLFKLNTKAWDYFCAQAESYKNVMKHWIMIAKQEKTRISRLEKTIQISEQQKRMQ